MSSIPDGVLLHVFSYLPLPYRWHVGSVCKTWYRICQDPYLYRDVTFEHLELRELVQSLQRLNGTKARIQSLKIDGCYSQFIQSTVVPVHFIHQDASTPMLFSHIHALKPLRRRAEYVHHGFELHNQFSDAIITLLRNNRTTLQSLTIVNCELDLEMTELFCAIASQGQSITSLTYLNNHDKGIQSSGMLQAIVTGCPKMRYFRGLHAGMNDIVLLTMARHWPSLRHLAIASLKSKSVLDQSEFWSESSALHSGFTAPISGHGFWQLITHCTQLETLELHDLACISNWNLAVYESWQSQWDPTVAIVKEPCLTSDTQLPVSIYASSSLSSSSYVPSETKPLPGSSLRRLYISKYMTMPLSRVGCASLLRIFPNLQNIEYDTNYYTFAHRFAGMTRAMVDAERRAIEALFNQRQLAFQVNWNQAMTTEQRLMTGTTEVSEG